jgi:multidrug efflux system membrane fusion protein
MDKSKMDERNEQLGRPSWGSRAAIAIVAIILIAAVVWGVKHRQAAAAAQASAGRTLPPVPIIAGKVMQKDVPIYLDGLGTVQAFNTVTVAVRVDGQLKKVAFTEGQDVKAGDLLAQIDPAPYQAALDQAIGKKGQDVALLENAKADLKREDDLFAAKVDSQQVWATQKALVDQYDAAVKADEAAISAARVNLAYTDVTSPIEGRTGIRLIDQGNIVHAADSNGLVVITQLKPISVVFTLPEQNLDEIHKQMAADNAPLKTLAVGRDDNDVLDEGKLAVIDNQIDPTTGTIKLKATFNNENLRLWPGQFVNVRLLLSETNTLVVPAVAIQRGPDGPYVFVIDNGKPRNGARGNASGGRSDGSEGAPATTDSPAPEASAASTASFMVTTASAAPIQGAKAFGGRQGTNGAPRNLTVRIQAVTVAPQVENGEAMVTSGLQAGERVVVDGQYKLQDGSPVKISAGTNAPNVNAGPKNSIE